MTLCIVGGGAGCDVILAGPGSGDDSGGGLRGAAAEEYLTDAIDLPPGSFTLEDPETDESISVTSNGSGAMATVQPGGGGTVSVSFNAPNANIVAGGIRFGSSGPIQAVPISGAMGQTSGTLSFPFQLPSSICQDLSRICHDIKCYEFAVTDVGTVSRANITDMAVLCGNCDEPSCQGLLDMCVVPDAGPVLSTSCRETVEMYRNQSNSGNACIDRCWDPFLNCLINSNCMDTGCSSQHSNCVQGCL